MAFDPGATIVTFTDGVTESQNPDREWYGVERLRDLIRKNAGGAELTGQAILDDLLEFSAGSAQHDDVTLLAFGRTD